MVGQYFLGSHLSTGLQVILLITLMLIFSLRCSGLFKLWSQWWWGILLFRYSHFWISGNYDIQSLIDSLMHNSTVNLHWFEHLCLKKMPRLEATEVMKLSYFHQIQFILSSVLAKGGIDFDWSDCDEPVHQLIWNINEILTYSTVCYSILANANTSQ